MVVGRSSESCPKVVGRPPVGCRRTSGKPPLSALIRFLIPCLSIPECSILHALHISGSMDQCSKLIWREEPNCEFHQSSGARNLKSCVVVPLTIASLISK